MSTKTSLFLTEDNEHCYTDMIEPTYKDGKYIGDPITLEFDKKNITVIKNDENDLIINIPPGSEIYKRIKGMKD